MHVYMLRNVFAVNYVQRNPVQTGKSGIEHVCIHGIPRFIPDICNIKGEFEANAILILANTTWYVYLTSHLGVCGAYNANKSTPWHSYEWWSI